MGRLRVCLHSRSCAQATLPLLAIVPPSVGNNNEDRATQASEWASELNTYSGCVRSLCYLH